MSGVFALQSKSNAEQQSLKQFESKRLNLQSLLSRHLGSENNQANGNAKSSISEEELALDCFMESEKLASKNVISTVVRDTLIQSTVFLPITKMVIERALIDHTS